MVTLHTGRMIDVFCCGSPSIESEPTTDERGKRQCIGNSLKHSSTIDELCVSVSGVTLGLGTVVG